MQAIQHAAGFGRGTGLVPDLPQRAASAVEHQVARTDRHTPRVTAHDTHPRRGIARVVDDHPGHAVRTPALLRLAHHRAHVGQRAGHAARCAGRQECRHFGAQRGAYLRG
ncbi:hypothetical protein D9M68_743240 [compost metagenome]